MIRKIKRALGIRFSAKALIRNPAVYLRQTGTGFRGFPQLAVDLFERRTASIVQVGANDGGPNPSLTVGHRIRTRLSGIPRSSH